MKGMVLFAAIVGAVVPAMAQAQFARPEQAVRYRQSVMNIMGNHMGRINAMVQGRVPFDANQAAANATVIETLSRLPWPAFDEKANVLNTRALPEIWSDPAKFKAANERFQGEAGKLVAAAKAGPDQLKSAFGAVGQACNSCHDSFQRKQ